MTVDVASRPAPSTDPARPSERVNASLVVVWVTVACLLLPATPLTQAAGVAGIVVCSGMATLWAMRVDGLPLRYRLSLCLAAGVLAFLFVGALLGAVLSALGVARPLSRLPLSCAWIVLLVALSVAILRSGADPVRRWLRGARPRAVGWAAALAVPPVLALWGAADLNTFGSGAVAVTAALLVVAMAVLALFAGRSTWGPPPVLLLMSAIVTGALQTPLRGAWLAGVDTQHEYHIGSLAIAQATFPLAHYVDPYGGMLSLTVWPAELRSLFGVNLRTTMVLFPALFLGLCVLVLWTALRERATARTSAALSCFFVLGSVPLLQEMPQITRQCYALFFFSVLVLALSSRTLSVTQARVAAVVGGVGVAVTHYSTAYLAAGAVLCGYLLSLALRQERARRVLSLPVTAVVVGAAVLWGAVVARTGNSIGNVLSSIRKDGLNFLPSGGGLINRWLRAASINRLVNARVIRAADVAARHHQYHWMKVLPRASHQPLVNVPTVTTHGVPVLGGIVSAGSALLAQLVLLLAAICIVGLIYVARRRRELACIAGVAAFFLVFAAISRFSRTIGVDFSPSRVQAQSYLLFVVVVVIALELFPWRSVLERLHLHRTAVLAGVAVLAALAVSTSTALANFVERGAPLPATMSLQGEQAQRLLRPSDVEAAKWLAKRRPAPAFVQSDRFGELALDVYGYNDRRDFVDSVDPIIVNDPSWIFAYHTNVAAGTARGGDNVQTGVFEFPLAYFLSTRSVLYSSPTDVVFGAVPYHGP